MVWKGFQYLEKASTNLFFYYYYYKFGVFQKTVQKSGFLKLEHLDLQIQQNNKVTCFWHKLKPSLNCVKILVGGSWCIWHVYSFCFIFFFVSLRLYLVSKCVKHYSDCRSKNVKIALSIGIKFDNQMECNLGLNNIMCDIGLYKCYLEWPTSS